MSKTKVAFFSQSELFVYFFNCFDSLDKNRLPKNAFFLLMQNKVLICKYASLGGG